MNRIEKIKELKKYIHSLSREKTHYKDGTTYSDIVIDGKSLCKSNPPRKHENQHLRIDKIVESVGDINGKTFIDLGSSSGYMVFRLKELGASSCVGIECIGELINISNKINDIEEYDDINFYYEDFIRRVDSLPTITGTETFDCGICFSSINAVCSNDEEWYSVVEWLESIGKVVPILFVEFSEYITNTLWEDEETKSFLESIEVESEREQEKENIFKRKTEEMFDNLECLKSWKLLGMTDYNRKLYRLDYK
jgi:hypothetical protein